MNDDQLILHVRRLNLLSPEKVRLAREEARKSGKRMLDVIKAHRWMDDAELARLEAEGAQSPSGSMWVVPSKKDAGAPKSSPGAKPKRPPGASAGMEDTVLAAPGSVNIPRRDPISSAETEPARPAVEDEPPMRTPSEVPMEGLAAGSGGSGATTILAVILGLAVVAVVIYFVLKG